MAWRPLLGVGARARRRAAFSVFPLDDLLALVHPVGGDVVGQMGFARLGVEGQVDALQGVVAATHAPARRGLFVLLNCHFRKAPVRATRNRLIAAARSSWLGAGQARSVVGVGIGSRAPSLARSAARGALGPSGRWESRPKPSVPIPIIAVPVRFRIRVWIHAKRMARSDGVRRRVGKAKDQRVLNQALGIEVGPQDDALEPVLALLRFLQIALVVENGQSGGLAQRVRHGRQAALAAKDHLAFRLHNQRGSALFVDLAFDLGLAGKPVFLKGRGLGHARAQRAEA